ncbi:MAG: hypothetical protein Q4A64_01815 [Porphyromonadaceae bacterium]|nr:hypothetical protein [Porphyromonadaceae bacterium]
MKEEYAKPQGEIFEITNLQSLLVTLSVEGCIEDFIEGDDL